MEPMLKRYLEAGRIVGTHGLLGEVKVTPWCDSPEFLLQFKSLYFDEGALERRVASARVHKTLVLIRFEGIDSIDGAMKLIKKVIYIDRELVKLPEGNYFEQDLIGLRVEDEKSGRVYGRLSAVYYTGANDVYAVQPETGAEVLIPAIPDVIRRVEPEAGRMLITPLRGLFEDED